jgi:hypothetical protein
MVVRWRQSQRCLFRHEGYPSQGFVACPSSRTSRRSRSSQCRVNARWCPHCRSTSRHPHNSGALDLDQGVLTGLFRPEMVGLRNFRTSLTGRLDNLYHNEVGTFLRAVSRPWPAALLVKSAWAILFAPEFVPVTTRGRAFLLMPVHHGDNAESGMLAACSRHTT